MSYILDQKKNLGAFVIPVGASNKITTFGEFDVIPSGSTTSQFNVASDGTIQIGDSNNVTYNNLILNAGVNFQFRQITDAGTNYLMTNNDYAIEIISATYGSVTLPSASGIGGRTYIISNGSTNTALLVKSQIGDFIDKRTTINLKRINDHIRVQSNNIDEWYII